MRAKIYTRKWRIEFWLFGRIRFQIGNTTVEIHNLKIIITKHFKAFLGFKQPNHAN